MSQGRGKPNWIHFDKTGKISFQLSPYWMCLQAASVEDRAEPCYSVTPTETHGRRPLICTPHATRGRTAGRGTTHRAHGSHTSASPLSGNWDDCIWTCLLSVTLHRKIWIKWPMKANLISRQLQVATVLSSASRVHVSDPRSLSWHKRKGKQGNMAGKETTEVDFINLVFIHKANYFLFTILKRWHCYPC